MAEKNSDENPNVLSSAGDKAMEEVQDTHMSGHAEPAKTTDQPKQGISGQKFRNKSTKRAHEAEHVLQTKKRALSGYKIPKKETIFGFSDIGSESELDYDDGSATDGYEDFGSESDAADDTRDDLGGHLEPRDSEEDGELSTMTTGMKCSTR